MPLTIHNFMMAPMDAQPLYSVDNVRFYESLDDAEALYELARKKNAKKNAGADNRSSQESADIGDDSSAASYRVELGPLEESLIASPYATTFSLMGNALGCARHRTVYTHEFAKQDDLSYRMHSHGPFKERNDTSPELEKTVSTVTSRPPDFRSQLLSDFDIDFSESQMNVQEASPPANVPKAAASADSGGDGGAVAGTAEPSGPLSADADADDAPSRPIADIAWISAQRSASAAKEAAEAELEAEFGAQHTGAVPDMCASPLYQKGLILGIYESMVHLVGAVAQFWREGERKTPEGNLGNGFSLTSCGRLPLVIEPYESVEFELVHEPSFKSYSIRTAIVADTSWVRSHIGIDVFQSFSSGCFAGMPCVSMKMQRKG